MKTFRTPTIKATVNYDPALLKSNGIYLAATDNEKIYTDTNAEAAYKDFDDHPEELTNFDEIWGKIESEDD